MEPLNLSDIFMAVGFILAAYSIVANDAVQTLGTFLSSNSRRPWWLLWLYACSVLVAVFIYGWFSNHGDLSFGRLARFPVPHHFTWIHVVPPLFIILLTRFGVPVSTTFLVLTVFAPAAFGKMLTKSLVGYAVAFVVGFVAYRFVASTIEKRFIASSAEAPPLRWIVLQWLATAFLWSQWLIQDLANIFVYMPRKVSVSLLGISLLVMLLLHAMIFRQRGGTIQKIVTSKTNTADIRSATIIDFIYALVLLVFKEYSDVPMSTTWVFIGLLAGREVAIALHVKSRSLADTGRIVVKDGAKLAVGLGVSVALAFGLPILHEQFSGPDADGTDRATSEASRCPTIPSGASAETASHGGQKAEARSAERAECDESFPDELVEGKAK